MMEIQPRFQGSTNQGDLKFSLQIKSCFGKWEIQDYSQQEDFVIVIENGLGNFWLSSLKITT